MDVAEKCPRCGQWERTGWLATTNEWEYYCPLCDIRFNEAGEIRPDDQNRGRNLPVDMFGRKK